MEVRERLEAAIGDERLLEHPFYVAWRDGTLPVEALKTYSAEYGVFIAAVAEGWERVGNTEHAAEEREHAVMWDNFAASLGATVDEARLPEARALMETTRRLFENPATAWGALYAFEAQQPGTAREKLDGLIKHYGYQPEDAGTEYFRVHADDYHEADDIVAGLSPEQVDAAVDACAQMSRALWDALSGVSATVS